MPSLALDHMPEPIARQLRRGGEMKAGPALSTGHTLLNIFLPGGGWPVQGAVEVLEEVPGQALAPLLLPGLALLARRHKAAPVVMVAPPFEPFTPALAAAGLPAERLLHLRCPAPSGASGSAATRLWAAEQALRCADVAAVLLWLAPGQPVQPRQLLRLQLAQQAGHGGPPKLLFVMRGLAAQHQASPARLRLRLEAAADGVLAVHLFKRAGPPLDEPVLLPAHHRTLAGLLASRRRAGGPVPSLARQALPPAAHVDRPVTQP